MKFLLYIFLLIPAGFLLPARPALPAPDVIRAREGLESSDQEIRSRAALDLAGEGEEAVELLTPLLGDPSLLVRHSAAYSLARIGGPEVEEIFRAGLSSSSADRRRVSVLGLGMIGRADRNVIAPLVEDSNWEVRWSAAYVLGRAGDRRDLPRLNRLAEADPYRDPASGEYPVREAAEKSIRRLESIIGWQTDREAAGERARRTGRPLFLYFRGGGSDLCRQFEREIFTEEKIIDAAQRMIPVWLDHSAAPEDFTRYRVTRVPSIVISSPDGVRRERIEGTVPPEDLLERMLAFLEPERSAPRLRSRLRESPGDLETAWQLSSIYLERGQWDGAVRLLDRIIAEDPHNLSSLLDNALFARAYIEGRRGNYLRSAREIESLLERFPVFGDRAEALYCGGLAYLRAGNPGRAGELLDQLVREYPRGPLAETAGDILAGLDKAR